MGKLHNEGFDTSEAKWARASQTAGREAQGNPDKKSRFLRHAESTTQKEKILTGKFYLPKSGFAFYSDFLTLLGKKAKKMAEKEGFEPSTIRLMKLHLKEGFIQSFERNFLKF